MGLKKINCLTVANPVTQLRVDLSDYEGHQKYAQYRYFPVDDASANYKLYIGGYWGTAGDSMVQSYNLNGMQFTTHVRDNDAWSSGNCAVRDQGAWYSTGAAPILTTVLILTSMGSTSVELVTAEASRGTPLTQL